MKDALRLMAKVFGVVFGALSALILAGVLVVGAFRLLEHRPVTATLAATPDFIPDDQVTPDPPATATWDQADKALALPVAQLLCHGSTCDILVEGNHIIATIPRSIAKGNLRFDVESPTGPWEDYKK